MILYLAGNAGHGSVGKYREDFLIKEGTNRLMSYFWIEAQFGKNFRRWINAKETSVSGHRDDRA